VRIVSSTPVITSVNNNGADISIGNAGVWLGTTTDWNTPSNWCGGIPTSATNVYVKQTIVNQPIMSADAVCNNINLDANATLSLNGNTLTINGNILGQGNMIGSATSSIVVNGTGSAGNLSLSQNASSSKSLLNLTVNRTSSGKLFLGRNIDLIGTLTMIAGTLFAGNKLTLKSTTAATASIAPVIAGALIKGNVVAERFIPGNKTGWAMLGTPVEGTKIADWQDDFATSGFTGSTGFAGGFVSIQNYNETTNGTSGLGYVPATNVTNSVAVGGGHWAYVATGYTTTADINMEVSGPIKVGAFNLPVSYTASTPTALPNEDGWNLVANPYCSAIDWNDASWTKTNIANAIYIYNTDNAQYATYVTGVGVNGGTQFIAQHQAFWVKASAANPALTAQENVKSANNTTLLRQATNALPQQTIKLILNNSADECLVRFLNEATNSFDDEFDAQKLINSQLNVPNIYTLNEDKKMAINTLNSTIENVMVPIAINNLSVNKNTLQATISSGFEGEAYLYDNKENTFINLREQPNNIVYAANNTEEKTRYFLSINSIEKVETIAHDKSIFVFPNPATTNIHFYNLPKQANINIYKAFGEICYTENSSLQTTINTHNYSNGIFYYKITNQNGEVISGKFMKE